MSSKPPAAGPLSDPFGSGRTIIVPQPGARAAAVTAEAVAQPRIGADVARDFPQLPIGLNPLLALANEILALVPALRQTVHHDDPAALKDQLAYAIREFERRARGEGVASERVNAACYILCTVLDEAASATPWGGSGIWARQSLLVSFHNEAIGGEKVFQLMARLAENVPANRDLLELIYASLAVGFEGRYRAIEGGQAQLDAIRERLAHLLRSAGGDYPRALAQNWASAARRANPLASWLPLWVTLAIASALLTITYLALSFNLAARSDSALTPLQGLALPHAPPVAAAAVAIARPRLAQFLADDIQAERVRVLDQVDSSVVTVRGDGLFESGSALPEASSRELLMRIADALGKVPGSVVVAGYTDDQRIRSVRYPSNYELSKARAEAVREILIDRGLPPDRVIAEGHGEADPIAPNVSAENRAQNRRVEITLRAERQ